MSNPIRVTKSLTAAHTNEIALPQTPLGTGNLTLNGLSATGGVATLNTSRRVLFTFSDADAARTFVVYGTSGPSGIPIRETVSGANSPATSVTTLDFYTITRISVDAATVGQVTVGTNGVGSTQWFSADYQMHPVPISVAVAVTGTVNYTVNYTYDDLAPVPQGPTSTPVVVNTTAWNDPILAAVAASGETTFDHPITGIRFTVNSGTGSIAATIIQAGAQG